MQKGIRHDRGNMVDLRPLVLRFVESGAEASGVGRDVLTNEDPVPPTYATSGKPVVSLETKITMVHDESCDDT
jgi:hypothetical protein